MLNKNPTYVKFMQYYQYSVSVDEFQKSQEISVTRVGFKDNVVVLLRSMENRVSGRLC
jgi:hypothetical protein